MRRYDDPVDVRRGRVRGAGGAVEGPEQFLWKGRLWKVSAVVAQWVETGAWWHSSGVHAVLGADDWGAEHAGAAGARERGQTAAAGRTHPAVERGVWRGPGARGAGARERRAGGRGLEP